MKRAENRTWEADELRACYEEATRGMANHIASVQDLTPDGVFRATGDPLARSEPDLALRAYDILKSKRPNVALRQAEAAIYGDALASIVDLARSIRNAPRTKSALQAAQKAVALAAKNGLWIGVSAPVSFDEAVDKVRREISTKTADALVGDTGRKLFAIPRCGLRLPMPEQGGMILPPKGQVVPDTLYWRRRVADGDVTAQPMQEKKDQL